MIKKILTLFLIAITTEALIPQNSTTQLNMCVNNVRYLHEQEQTRSSGSSYLTKLINNNDNVIVIFYEDWCQPCKRMTPVFEEIAPTLPSIIFIKIKREFYRSIFNEYNLQTVPAILFFKKGKLITIQPSSLNKSDLVSLIHSIYD